MNDFDKNVAYYPVLMIAKNDKHIPDYPLSDEYHFVDYDPKYKIQWMYLHVALGQFPSFAYATQYFEQTFEVYPNELAKQMFLVVDKDENLVGSSSIWKGYHFGVEKLRVHWLGVDRKHQRKGIAKALLCRCMQFHKEWTTNDELYLSTQTNRYIAIHMYKKFGFEPYKKEMPVNFQGNKKTFLKDNKTAWNIIDERIKKLK